MLWVSGVHSDLLCHGRGSSWVVFRTMEHSRFVSKQKGRILCQEEPPNTGSCQSALKNSLAQPCLGAEGAGLIPLLCYSVLGTSLHGPCHPQECGGATALQGGVKGWDIWGDWVLRQCRNRELGRWKSHEPSQTEGSNTKSRMSFKLVA